MRKHSFREDPEQMANLLFDLRFRGHGLPNFGAHEFPVALAEAEGSEPDRIFREAVHGADFGMTARPFTVRAEIVIERSLAGSFALALKFRLCAIENHLGPLAFEEVLRSFTIRGLSRVKRFR